MSHHDGSPASGVPVKINLLDTPQLVSGRASVTVNMLKHPFPQTITVRRLAAGPCVKNVDLAVDKTSLVIDESSVVMVKAVWR